MVTFNIPADELYAVSKPAFYRLISEFEISICFNCTQMTFNLRRIAEMSKKSDRVNIMALILKYAPAERKKDMQTWLDDYFSSGIQLELFGIDYDTYSKSHQYSKALQRALDKLGKR